MGRKKRNNTQISGQGGAAPQASKQPKLEAGESYLVKKYRPEKHYQSMDAFVRYTKSHRMNDAAYVRWNRGVTPDKPFVFSTRIGGTDLGWGRGRTRESAMDCAVRATFFLVGAHGYKNFTLDDDCMTEAPMEAFPPPPPPPPLPLGLPPPPPPDGLPPPPPPPQDLIPQPQLQTQAPVATSLQTESPVTLTLNAPPAPPQRKELKGGLKLVYDPGDLEMSMEERRASLVRYQKMIPA